PRPDRFPAVRSCGVVLSAARVQRGLEPLRVSDFVDIESEDVDLPRGAVSRPARDLVEPARPRVVFQDPENRLVVPEPAQFLFARIEESAPDAGSPVLRVHVDGEQLAVRARISAGPDADEPHDLAVLLRAELRG